MEVTTSAVVGVAIGRTSEDTVYDFTGLQDGIAGTANAES